MPRREPPRPSILLAIGVVHLVITAATWRDVDRRPESEIRGSKRLWKAISAANTAGSLAYFLIGRKHGSNAASGRPLTGW